MTRKHTQEPSYDWWTDHPWFYIYTVISGLLLVFLLVAFLLDFLKGALP